MIVLELVTDVPPSGSRNGAEIVNGRRKYGPGWDLMTDFSMAARVDA